MAAHSVTVLCDMASVVVWNDKMRGKYGHAMDYAPSMDILEMDHEDWYTLRGLLEEGTEDAISDKVREVLYKQLQKWLRLDKPRTHKEWTERKHCKPTAQLIVERIEEFEEECQNSEHTDTDKAWGLLYWIREQLENWGM